MESFYSLVKKSYCFNQDSYNQNPKWQILRVLYDKNYVFAENKEYQIIPKKIHQIWLGSTIPSTFKKLTETWQKYNPDWEYKLWTDDNIDDIDIPDRKLFNSIKNMGQKSDYLRYHILNQFGGVYADTDFECLKPFDPLLYLDFFVGVGYPSDVELYIGLMGSIPGHPILQQIVHSLHHWSNLDGDKWQNVFNTTGTYFFTRNFFAIVRGFKRGIVAFPTDFFYPFPNNVRKNGNSHDYIQPNSYALHHWAVSWSKTKSK